MAFLSSAACRFSALPDDDCEAVLGCHAGNRQRQHDLSSALPAPTRTAARPRSAGARRIESALGLFSARGAGRPLCSSSGTWLEFQPVQRSCIRCSKRCAASISRIWRRSCAYPWRTARRRCWPLANALPMDFPMSSLSGFLFTPASGRKRAWPHDAKRRAPLSGRTLHRLSLLGAGDAIASAAAFDAADLGLPTDLRT